MFEQCVEGESMFASCRGGLAYVIGLDRALCHDGVRALLQRFPNQEFELTRLVATTREARAIVTLDPKSGPAEMLAQPRHGLNWGWLVTQVNTGKLL